MVKTVNRSLMVTARRYVHSDELFAETLAAHDSRSFIEEITPVVHQFEEERNEEEA